MRTLKPGHVVKVINISRRGLFQQQLPLTLHKLRHSIRWPLASFPFRCLLSIDADASHTVPISLLPSGVNVFRAQTQVAIQIRLSVAPTMSSAPVHPAQRCPLTAVRYADMSTAPTSPSATLGRVNARFVHWCSSATCREGLTVCAYLFSCPIPYPALTGLFGVLPKANLVHVAHASDRSSILLRICGNRFCS